LDSRGNEHQHTPTHITAVLEGKERKKKKKEKGRKYVGRKKKVLRKGNAHLSLPDAWHWSTVSRDGWVLVGWVYVARHLKERRKGKKHMEKSYFLRCSRTHTHAHAHAHTRTHTHTHTHTSLLPHPYTHINTTSYTRCNVPLEILNMTDWTRTVI
tara:strand:- start:3 stop:467 length:465 start_codon:yes stop_codon:yes gene_type:complete